MTQKLILAAAIFGIGTLLFAAFAVVPLLRGISADSEKLEEQYREVLKASLAEREMAEFARFSQERSRDFARLEALFVDAETPVGFIEFLEAIAASSNLELKITPGNPRKERGVPWSIMDFQLASTASYPDFRKFVEKLENGPYLLELRNTGLTRNRGVPADGEEALQEVSFTMQVQVFTGSLPESS